MELLAFFLLYCGVKYVYALPSFLQDWPVSQSKTVEDSSFLDKPSPDPLNLVPLQETRFEVADEWRFDQLGVSAGQSTPIERQPNPAAQIQPVQQPAAPQQNPKKTLPPPSSNPPANVDLDNNPPTGRKCSAYDVCLPSSSFFWSNMAEFYSHLRMRITREHATWIRGISATTEG